MKKIVNFRSFVYSSLMLSLNVLCCFVALNTPWLGIISILILTFVPIVCAFAAKKKLIKYKFVTVIMTACLCFASTIIFFVNVYSWTPSEIVSGSEYHVSGRVEDTYSEYDDSIVIIEDLYIGGRTVNGRLKLVVKGDHKKYSIGERLEFSSTLYKNDLYTGFSIDGGAFRNDMRYSATARSDEIVVLTGAPDPIGVIKSYVKDVFARYMGDDMGSIAYGIITGDKNDISNSTFMTFSGAGIAHILAVSGLHIGFLMTIVTFVLKKLRVRRLPTFIINVVFLFAYSLFAGFSPSVTRACIMFLVASGALLLGEESDSLNCLGVAVTFMLTVSPIILFDAGFLMSVGAVFGIINFTPVFMRGFKRIRLPERVSRPLAVTASAQLGVLPASIYFFGVVQTYSLLANVILMPLMSLAFISVFLSLVLSLIPPLGFLLQLSGVFVEAISAAAGFFSSLPLATLSIAKSVFIFLLYPLYFLMADFVNLPNKKSVAIVSALTTCFILILLLLI